MFASPFSAGNEKGMQNRADKLILTRRKDEYTRNQMMAQKAYYERADLHSQFENSAQKSIQRKHLGRALEECRKEEKILLEMRRERLSQLYKKDVETWREELKQMEPNKDMKITQMRERVAELQKNREEERQRVVKDKFLEQKRRNCDELRRFRSKQMVEQVKEVRQVQVQEKNERRKMEIGEKQYYDALWEKERLKKVAREEKENELKAKLSQMTFQENQHQIQQLAEARKKEAEMKEKEAAVMLQILELQRVAEEHAKKRKAEENLQLHHELDQVNKAKIQARQREVRETLEADLKWVQSLMQQEANEQENQQVKKEELRNELLAFHNLIMQHKAQEEARKTELEQFYRQEESRVWALKIEKWNKESNQRAKLMQQVIQAREAQLEHTLEQARQNLEAKRKERERLEQWVADEAEKERQRQKKHRQSQKAYHDILCSQIAENQAKRQRERELEEREYQIQLNEAQAYQEWLENELQITSSSQK